MRLYKVTIVRDVYCRDGDTADHLVDIARQQMEQEAQDLADMQRDGKRTGVAALRARVESKPITDDLPMA